MSKEKKGIYQEDIMALLDTCYEKISEWRSLCESIRRGIGQRLFRQISHQATGMQGHDQ